MIKLFTQNAKNKFINNILYIDNEQLLVSTADMENSLYKIHSSFGFDAYLFNVSLFSNEISQFISEYFTKLKLFLYHDKGIDNNMINTYGSSCIHLVSEVSDDHRTKLVPSNLVSPQIFIPNTLNNSRDGSIAYFLDEQPEIPANIKNILYPTTKMPIRLFNSLSIENNQHLGILSEQDKAKVLNRASYFISHKSYYEQEALLCGCAVLDYDSIDISKIKPVASDYISYQQFMLGLL